MMTNEELDAIKARANAATPGEWRSHGRGVYFGDSGSLVDGEFSNSNDACFIASARRDVPALIAEIYRLRKAARIVRTLACRDDRAPVVFVDDGATACRYECGFCHRGIKKVDITEQWDEDSIGWHDGECIYRHAVEWTENEHRAD